MHKSLAYLNEIHNVGFKLIARAPYSPNLAPSDMYLFPKIMAGIREIGSEWDNDVIMEVRNKIIKNYF